MVLILISIPAYCSNDLIYIYQESCSRTVYTIGYVTIGNLVSVFSWFFLLFLDFYFHGGKRLGCWISAISDVPIHL